MLHFPTHEEFLQLLSGLDVGTVYGSILGILILCGMGLPIPEDVTIITAGLLASTGKISLPGAFVACFVGVLTGDSILFSLGRTYGRGLFKLPVFKTLFPADRIIAAEKQVNEHQHFICFIGRFLPGLRAGVFSLAGALGVKPRVFLIQDGAAALLSVPLWIYLGFWFGSNWDEAFKKARSIQEWLLGGVALVVILYALRIRHLRKNRKSA